MKMMTTRILGALMITSLLMGCGSIEDWDDEMAIPRDGDLVAKGPGEGGEDEDSRRPRGCEVHRDCDDGEYCNGFERCIEGRCEDGEPVDCGDGNECFIAYCDEERDSCIDMILSEDRDGDGFDNRPCGEDCDDMNPEVYPGAPERCNGIDDDCDGEVDEDLVQDCDEFGRRTCVDGEWTDCHECTVCIPGSRRFCDTPSHDNWGEQICNDDGDGWGECYEISAPSGCEGYVYDQHCCLEEGHCCQDWQDFDGDGDYNDTVGACDDIICPSAD